MTQNTHNQQIEMVPGYRAGEPVPARLACSYERPDLGWNGPFKIYVATDRDMVITVTPWCPEKHIGGGSSRFSGKDALLQAKQRMEQFTLQCQPKPTWEKEIPTMDGFPSNVTGYDWTALPMTAPPEEETDVGRYEWCEHDRDDDQIIIGCRRDYFVLPDGGAKMIETRKPWEEGEEEVQEEIFLPGTWEPHYPTTDFGSRAGIFIKAKEQEVPEEPKPIVSL